jgi:hypothetical protein
MSSDTPTDPTEREAVDRDELELRIRQHWLKQGIVREYNDVFPIRPDEFEDDDTIVFRASKSAIDFLVAAGLLAAPAAQPDPRVAELRSIAATLHETGQEYDQRSLRSSALGHAVAVLEGRADEIERETPAAQPDDEAVSVAGVMFPDDWRKRLGECESSAAGVDLVESWIALAALGGKQHG